MPMIKKVICVAKVNYPAETVTTFKAAASGKDGFECEVRDSYGNSLWTVGKTYQLTLDTDSAEIKAISGGILYDDASDEIVL